MNTNLIQAAGIGSFLAAISAVFVTAIVVVGWSRGLVAHLWSERPWGKRVWRCCLLQTPRLIKAPRAWVAVAALYCISIVLSTVSQLDPCFTVTPMMADLNDLGIHAIAFCSERKVVDWRNRRALAWWKPVDFSKESTARHYFSGIDEWAWTARLGTDYLCATLHWVSRRMLYI